VCVCVCLSTSICLEPHVRSLLIFSRMLPMAVARSSSGTVTKSQWEGAVSGVFLTTDSALLGVRCKMDNSILAGKGVMGVHSAGKV